MPIESFSTIRVRWIFERDPGSDVCVLRCRDDVTQRDYRIELPVHAVPSLRDGLQELIDRNPDDFPPAIVTRYRTAKE